MQNLKPCGFAIALQILFNVAAPLLTQAATITWTNTAGGNWNVPANWSPNRVPGATDTALITAPGNYEVSITDNESVSNLVLGAASGTLTVAILGGTFTVNGTGSDSAQSALVISGGSVSGTGSMVVGGPLTWSGGTIYNTVLFNGGSENNGLNLRGGTLVNSGAFAWNGQIFFYPGSQFTNLVSGTTTFAAGAQANSEGGNNLDNEGQFSVAGTGTAYVNIPFFNHGAVTVSGSTLELTGGGTETGLFTNAVGGTLNLNAGTYTFTANSSVVGAGNFTVSGATANLAGSVNVGGTSTVSGGTANVTGACTITNTLIINNGALNLNGSGTITPVSLALGGGSVAGSQAVQVLSSGGFNWSGGTIYNTVLFNGGSENNGLNLRGGTLVNSGAFAWNGQIFFYPGSQFTNLVSGTTTFAAGAQANNEGGNNLDNEGQFNVVGTGTAYVGLPFINNGAVTVNSGTLNINNGGLATGSWEVSTNAWLLLTSGYTFGAGSTVTGWGNVNFNGGTVNLAGTDNLSGSNYLTGGTLNLNASGSANLNGLTMTGGNLEGSTPMTINGPFLWTGGTISDGGGVTLNGPSTLTGGGLGLNNNTVLANAGVLTWNGGGFNLAGATITNLPGAIFNIAANVGFNNYGGNNVFGNAGLVEITGVTGTFYTSPMSFVNGGDVQLLSGTLNINNGGSATGSWEVSTNAWLLLTSGYTFGAGSTVTGLGNVNFNGGTINLAGSYHLSGSNYLTGSTLNLNASGSANFNGLTMTGGYLEGSVPMTINGPFAWTGGTIGESAGVTLNGPSTLTGSGLGLNNNAVLANAGVLTWNGGGFNLAGATITNLPGAVFNIAADVGCNNYGGNNVFGNAGLVEKTAAGGTTAFSPLYFINNGDVQAKSGTLNFNNGGTATGTFEVSALATLLFQGNFTLGTSSSVTGGGTVNFSGGTIAAGGTYNTTGTNLFTGATVNFTGNYTIANQPLTITGGAANFGAGGLVNLSGLTMSGGTLGGSLPVPVNGPFTWTGGTISDSGGVTLYGPSTLTGGGLGLNNNTVLANAGVLMWNGGGFNLTGATITNLPGAVFNIAANVGFNNYGGNNVFGNAGLVEITGVTGTFYTSPMSFVNGGDVQLLSGTLNINNGGSATGSWEVSTNAWLLLTSGYTFGAGSTVTGLGNVNFNGGTINLAGSYHLSGSNYLTGSTLNLNASGSANFNGLTMTGGYLEGSVPMTINGPFAWTGGTIGESAGVTLNGPSTLTGSGLGLNNNTVLANAGVLTWNGGGFNLAGATITNLPGAVFNIAADVGCNNYGGNNVFGNAGLVEKTAAGGTTAFSPLYFINNGDVQAKSGTLNFNNGGTATGTFEVSALATLLFQGNFTLGTSSSVTGGGTVNFNGGTIAAGGTYNVTGTNLFTGATVNFSGNYNFTNEPVTITGGAANFGAGGLVNLSGLTMSGGTLGGSLPVPVNGPFTWTGGAISDSGGVTLYGQSTLTGSGLGLNNNTVLANAGVLTWNGGGFNLTGATITNLPGAIFNIAANVGFNNYGGNNVFGNAGLVEKTAGTASMGFSPLYFINNGGTLAVEAGSINLNANAVFNETNGTLQFGLGGPGNSGQLSIPGTLNLGGSLAASLIDNYLPQAGDTMSLVEFNAHTGAFTNLNLPLLGAGLGWQVSYTSTAVAVQVITNTATGQQISGSVTDAHGNGVTNITVFVSTTNASGSVYLSTTTDQNGNYSINVANGTWQVGLQNLPARGYNPVTNQVAVLDNGSQVVNFVLQPYAGQLYTITTLVNAPDNSGSAASVTGAGTYPGGTPLTVTATANTSILPYSFVDWTEGGAFQSASSSYTFTVERDRQLVANFTLPVFTITVSNNPPLAGLVVGPGTNYYGETNILLAESNFGYAFSNWMEGGVVVGSSPTLMTVIYTNHNFVANYRPNNLFHLVATATSPSGLATVTGAGTYTNGQVGTFSTPVVIKQTPYLYAFQDFTLSNVLLSTSASFNKTFATTDPTNLYFVAVYSTLSVVPQVTNTLASYPNPVPATTNLVLSFQFDRSMNTNVLPAVELTNAAATLQPTVPPAGYWGSSAELNDTYVTPGITLSPGMDGTVQVIIAGAQDTNGDILTPTNTLSLTVDATPPVLSNVAAAPALTSALVTWASDKPASSQVEYGLTTSYGSLTPYDGNLVASHSETIASLAPNTLYHFRVHSQDVAGNASVSGDGTFTTLAAPDLVVQNLGVAGSLVSGGNLTITWDDFNHGPGITDTSWFDQVLVTNATTGQVLLNTVVAYNASQNGNLAVNGSQAQQLNFQLPNGPAGVGTINVTVTVNVYGSQNEVSLNNNSTSLQKTTALAGYPDLQVVNLVVTNGSLQSGGLMGIAWQDTNSGNAAVSSSFQDLVTVVNLDTTQTLASAEVPYDVGTLGNLAAGQAASQQYAFFLPSGSAGTGHLLVTIVTDSGNTVYEYNPAGTAQSNNTNSIMVVASEAPYPDLLVTNLLIPSAANAGQSIPISWTDTNQGSAAITSTWYDQVFLTSADTIAGGQLLGTFAVTGGLGIGQATNLTQMLTLPQFIQGSQWIVVKANASDSFYEPDTANNVMISTQALNVTPALVVSLSADSVAEAAGTNALTGTVTCGGNLSAPLTITLTTLAGTNLSVPVTVIVPAGGVAASFSVSTIDNFCSGNSVADAVIATAPGFAAASAPITVLENDATTLALSFSAAAVNDNAGPNAVTATVTRSANFGSPLTVTLQSGTPGSLTVPAAVVIPAGQSSATFGLSPVATSSLGDAQFVYILAAAAGYSTVSQPINLVNVNYLPLTLSLASDTVSKGAGNNADVGTITIPAPLAAAQHIQLTVSNVSILTIPPTVTIPAGATSVDFSISVGNDNLVTGPQTATLLAQALTPDYQVLTEGEASTNLLILDINGPTLGLQLTNSIIPKGSSTTVTVTLNTTPTSPVTVNLSATPAAPVTLPASVTVAAGQTSAVFTVSAVLDLKQTGTEMLTLGAAATGFNSAAAPLSVSDIYLPDLAVTSITAPAAGITGNQLTMSWVVSNIGLGAASNLTWVDTVYLASDPVGETETLVGSFFNVSPLGIGASYTNQTTLTLPSLPGDYWIIITTDSGDVVSELNYANNTAAMPTPILVNPAYRATLTSASPAVAPQGTAITLTGHTFNPVDNSPVASSPATVWVMVNGTSRAYSVTSDASGNFSYTFQPLASEVGDYTAGADYPAITSVSNQVSFVLLGMQAYPAGLTARLLPNQPLTGLLVLSNLTDQTLTGLTLSAPSYNGDLVSAFTFTNTTLPANGAVTVGYQFQTPLAQAAQLKFSLTAASAEGAQLAIPAVLTVLPLTPQLLANPAYLAQGMLVGTQTVVSFTLINSGGAASGDLTVQLPASLPWLALGSPATIPSIPAGGTATVVLTLSPPSNLPLTLYQGSLAIDNNLTGISMPFQFRAVSTGDGDLQVTTTDDYTYYVAGAPNVTNAVVTVRDAITTAVIAQTNSDQNGIAFFSGLPAGSYTVNATADGHNEFVGSATVTVGVTNDLEAFMPRQLVSYDWTVVPSDIPDVYNIQLQSVFQTQVPVPNVVIAEPQVMIFVFPDEASQFNLTLSNEGLIAAQGVTITVPDDPNYLITPLVTSVGTIPAQSTVVIPVTVQLRAAPAPNPSKSGSNGGVVAKDAGACVVAISPCLPSFNLNVEWYYPCGGNNVAQSRSAQLALLCETKDAANKVKSCLDKLLGLANSPGEWSAVNLATFSCNTIAAFLSCVGGNLTPCQQLGISAACGAATGGVAGAAAGAASGLPACICSHLSNFSLPPFPSSSSSDTSGGSSELLLPILPTGAYYVSGNPVVTEIKIGLCSDTAPEPSVVKRLVEGNAAGAPLKLGPAVVSHGSSAGVCADVRLQINQQVVLARTAFTGTLEINNGDSDAITEVNVTLNFQDATNGDASGDFVTEGPVLASLTAVDGTGTIAAGTTGSAVYTFIPNDNAASAAPATYQIGGTLSYLDNGQQVTVPLVSAPITVYPEAMLDLIYFQQRDVYGPDPLDPQLSEPSQPFDLGLLVKNVGAGTAHSFQISSGQPQIVDNEKGLLVNFTIIGTEVGDQPISPSLSANLGDISPGGVKEVNWDLLSSLAGKFISFSATFSHVNDLGQTNTSLIQDVEIHSLTHLVLADRPTDDDVPDYLVNDIPNPDSLPDTLYLSDGSVAPVNVVTNGAFDGPAAAGHLAVQLTTTVTNGWNYIQLPDPGVGYILEQVVRSDGLVLPMTNDAWTTALSFPSDTTAPVQENLVHLFDWAGTGSYTLYYHSTNTTPPAIVQLGPVTPFVQPGAVSSVDIVFSEPVDTGTFSYTNLSLTLNGGANVLTSGSGIGLVQVDDTNYVIEGLAPYTAASGDYQLTVNGDGIYDFWDNNAGNLSASVRWANGNAPVVVETISAVAPNPRNVPVTSVTVNFSKAISPATFTPGAVSLTLNGGPNLINSGVTITSQSDTAYTLSGLGQVTGAQGNYVLTVNAAVIQDASGAAGLGSNSLAWSMITTGPTIVALQPVTTNPRNIVVQTLSVSFSEPINPATFDYNSVTLTLNGGPNLITSAVGMQEISPTTFVITNISWVQGYAGTYDLTVAAAGVADLAGNPGSGSTNESWQIILETPPTPTNLFITPDTGISSTDGLTDTNVITLWGTVGASNLTLRVSDLTSDTYLGTANVNGTNFSAPLVFSATGAHLLQVIAVDAAGNVSAPANFNLFVDTVAPTAIIQAVTPSPISTPVTNLLVTFSKVINTNTISAANFHLIIDGVSSLTPTISILSSTEVLVAGLAASTGTNATYQLTLNLAGIQDLAGNTSLAAISTSWEFVNPTPPPVFAPVTNTFALPDHLFRYQLQATDSVAGPITYQLDASDPSGMAIGTNGLLSWTPTCAQGSTTNLVTVWATDNVVPSASSSVSFTVMVGDCLEVNVGSAIMQVGTTSSLPVTAFSSVAVTNLSFSLVYPVNRFTNWTITSGNSAVASSSAQVISPTQTLFSLAASNHTLLLGSAQLAAIWLGALPAPSGFVPLAITNVTAAEAIGQTVANITSQAGRVVVIGAQSLLEGRLATNAQRYLNLYGNPGASYQLAYNTNLAGTNWLPLVRVPMTNLLETFPVAAISPVVFYRAAEFSANPAILDLSFYGATNGTLLLYGQSGNSYAVQTATNVGPGAVWIPVTNFVLTNSFQFLPPISPTNSARFYRASH